MSKKISLEEIFDEIRLLTDKYAVDENDPEVFVLKPNEVSSLKDDIIKIVKEHLKEDLAEEADEEEETAVGDEEFDGYWFDDDDELA